MVLQEKLIQVIRDIPDFPKQGILFKDLSPILLDASLSKELVIYMANQVAYLKPEFLVCLESRGFWFGLALAHALHIPMVPIRKTGKLPGNLKSLTYDLEYGTETIEIQIGVLPKGARVLIHDDVLATGGTAKASKQLVQEVGGEVVGFSMVLEIKALMGRGFLENIPCLAVLEI